MSFLIIILIVTIITLTAATLVADRPYRRGRDGLKLISEAKISPLEKWKLLDTWRAPAATKQRYKQLEDAIQALEKPAKEPKA